jgi:hypothetical protein
MLEGRRRSRAYLASSVLLVASKFDEMPPPVPAATLEDLAAVSGDLRSLLRVAQGLSPELARLALTSTAVTSGDPRWAAVADALAAQAPGSAEARMAEAMRAYVADGGISRLREMLSSHIDLEALPIMVSELTALQAELRGSLGRLRVYLQPEPAREQHEADRRLLGALVVGLHGMITEMKNAATYFRDPQRIRVASADRTAEEAADTELLERIRQEAVLAVYAWPEWKALLSGFHKGQVLRPEEAIAEWARTRGRTVGFGWSGVDDDDEDEFERAAAAIEPQGRDDRAIDPTVTFPVSTRDFEVPFAETADALRIRACDLALDVVSEWVSNRCQLHDLVRRQMADTRIRHLLTGRLAALYPDGGVAVLGLLDLIVNISWVSDQFRRALKKTEQQAQPDPFPLAPKHALPWHSAYEKGAEPESLARSRHHSRAHRLRHDLAEGLAFSVQTSVAMAFGTLWGILEARLDWLHPQVPSQSALLTAPGTDDSDDGQELEPGLLDGLLEDLGTDDGEDPEDPEDPEEADDDPWH